MLNQGIYHVFKFSSCVVIYFVLVEFIYNTLDDSFFANEKSALRALFIIPDLSPGFFDLRGLADPVSQIGQAGAADLAQSFAADGFHIMATGETCRLISEAGVEVEKSADSTSMSSWPV